MSGVVVEVREPGRVPLRLVVGDRRPIGRAGDGLLLTDQAMSRHHCELRWTPEGLVVHDLGSSNGTTCNGQRVTSPRLLAPGDVVRMGDSEVVVEPDADADPSLVETFVGAATVRRAADGAPADPTAEIDPRGSIATIAAEMTSSAHAADDLHASVVGGTVTIVFSDIVDSTALTHRLGDSRWYEVLGEHNELLRGQLRRYDGTEVKSVGDGFLMTFPSARHGMLFCISVQRVLAERRDETFPVRVRMGVHTGEAVRQGDDLFGGHVNYAARVSALAGADEIVASSLSRDLASMMGDVTFGEARVVALKGFPGEHTIHPVEWR